MTDAAAAGGADRHGETGGVTVEASAPGKLILLGEYAVLDGAPAVVMAVDRRARVRLSPAPGRPDGEIRVHAPDLGRVAAGRLTADGVPQWQDEDTARALRLVTTVFSTLADRRLRHDPPAGATNALEVHLDTADFFETPGRKTGLGSSAALTVALAGALATWYGDPPPTLAGLVAAHRALQGGRGSGADVGAALSGGLIVYRGADTDAPHAQAAQLPAGLHFVCVFTGRSASTPAALARLATWREAAPAIYQRALAELTATAEVGAAALMGADADALLAALAEYGERLDVLGREAGIDIVSDDHRRLRNAATGCGVIYKSSGAGGGDIGIGISRDADHIAAFRHAAADLGYSIIDLSTASQGLDVCVGGSAQGGER